MRRRITLVLFGLIVLPAPASAQEIVEYYGTDILGSVRIVFDAAGNVVGRMDYGPFGEQLSPSTVGHKSYAGLFRDGEAALDYAEARMYQPRAGRFNAPDPVYAGLFNPQAWNRYSYALSSPVVFVDPTGTQAASGYEEYVVVNGDNPWVPMSDLLAFILGLGGGWYQNPGNGSGGLFEPTGRGRSLPPIKTSPTSPTSPTESPGSPENRPPGETPENPGLAASPGGGGPIPSCSRLTKRGNGGSIAVQTVPKGFPGAGTVAWGAYMNDSRANWGPWAATVTVNGRLDDAKTPPGQFYPPHGAVSWKHAKPGSVIDIRVLHVFADPANGFLPDVAYGHVTCRVQ